MRIAIIGGAGGMGKWFTDHLHKQGHSVIVADPKSNRHQSTEIDIASSNISSVDKADLVLIAVPLTKTSAVIQEVVPYMKKKSILCEISSVKANIIDVRVTSYQVRPLCIHPLFGPGTKFLKKKIALIPILAEEKEEKLLRLLFPDSRIIVVEAAEHDRIMALTLSLPYFANMIFASLLKNEDISLIEQLGGTTFAVQFMLSGSIMSHSPEFHLALHKENSHSIEILQKLRSQIGIELELLSDNTVEFTKSYQSMKDMLIEQVNLEEKYQEMYRVLETMEKQRGEDQKS
ncbi:MAG: prephenate dehydrogenase/arogenate dehydrogenase family protein [Candidatus Thorarchaeota archaeon]|jgi:prephenate dehydrogenase